MLSYCRAHLNHPTEASVTQRRICQFDLFQSIDPPHALPAAIEEESFALLVQLMQSMIAVIEAEGADEQDHD
jgi:hypothetical protein